MPDKELEILMYLRKHENASWIDILNTFGDYPETQRILRAMLTLEVVRISSAGERPPSCRLKLTDKGYQTVLAEEYRRDQLAKEMADKKSQQKVDRRFQLLNTLLSAIAGGILTLLIEHFPAVLNGLGKFFLWLSSLF
jgi:hypothetical protein